MAAQYHLTLPPVSESDGRTVAGALLGQLREQIGFIPNMHAYLANSPGLLETYMSGMQRFQAESGFSAAEQQIVLLTISRFNDCAYCVAAHSFAAEQSGALGRESIDAIRNGNTVSDVKLAMLSAFTEIMMESQGKPTDQDVSVFLAAGYEEAHILEIILAIAVSTISNFANHVFHTELDHIFSESA